MFLTDFSRLWTGIHRQNESMKSVELVCGTCGSLMSLEDESSSESILSLAWRFANAHVDCGYVTPGTSPEAADVLSDHRETE